MALGRPEGVRTGRAPHAPRSKGGGEGQAVGALGAGAPRALLLPSTALQSNRYAPHSYLAMSIGRGGKGGNSCGSQRAHIASAKSRRVFTIGLGGPATTWFAPPKRFIVPLNSQSLEPRA